VTSASRPVSAERRLFSLVLALLASREGLDKAEILSTVYGYAERYSPGGDNTSLDRQFERDKDDLRELGIPIETVDSPDAVEDNKRTRYRISKARYEVPAGLRFTPAESALLELAGHAWREGVLSEESRRALMKVRSLESGPAADITSYMPQLRVGHPAFEPLERAIRAHRVVEFDYRRPGQAEALRRRVLPLALVQFEGRWHLYGRDLHRDAQRTFLLSRIGGAVRVTRTELAPPPGDHAAAALAGLQRLEAASTVVLRVQEGSEAAFRLASRVQSAAQDGTVRIGCVDEAILADELASYGPEVRVIEPESLRVAVRERLSLALARHAPAPPAQAGDGDG